MSTLVPLIVTLKVRDLKSVRISKETSSFPTELYVHENKEEKTELIINFVVKTLHSFRFFLYFDTGSYDSRTQGLRSQIGAH